jgi:monofunctional biosynthetic peptidoglycan transglycosylase
MGLAVAALLGLAYEALTWPRVAALARQNPRTTAFIERYQAEERRADRKPRVAWKWVAYANISPELKRAALVSEDIGFFSHQGFEVAEIQDAVKEAVEDHEMPRGASTITQQVAKNLWLSPSRNPVRKLKEAILTVELERYLTKKRILEIYLNIAEFGPGVYGAEAAARVYFNKSAADLTEPEAAALAAGLPKPSHWHPGSKSRAYARRATIIQERMEKSGYLGKLI